MSASIKSFQVAHFARNPLFSPPFFGWLTLSGIVAHFAPEWWLSMVRISQKSTLETLTGISPFVSLCLPILAAVISIFAIYYAIKNNKKKILVVKLEELFETVQVLASYYKVFQSLYGLVMELRDHYNTKIVTRAQYFSKLEGFLPIEERNQIRKHLSRLDVLTDCYT